MATKLAPRTKTAAALHGAQSRLVLEIASATIDPSFFSESEYFEEADIDSLDATTSDTIKSTTLIKSNVCFFVLNQ